MRRLLPAVLLLIAAAPTGDPPIQPGQWEATSTATSIQVPGIPGFIALMMQKPQVEKRCIAPEDAKRGPIQALRNRKGCTVQTDVMTKDAFDFATLCPEKDGAQSTIHMWGRFTPTSYTASGTIRGTGGKKGDIRIDFTGSARRLGDCPAVKP